MDNTKEALLRASTLLGRHNDWDLIKALAEATTTEQCGEPSYKVFASARQAVQNVIDRPLPDFSATANRTDNIRALSRAIESLGEQ